MKKLKQIIECVKLYRAIKTRTAFIVFFKEYMKVINKPLGIGNLLPFIIKHSRKRSLEFEVTKEGYLKRKTA